MLQNKHAADAGVAKIPSRSRRTIYLCSVSLVAVALLVGSAIVLAAAKHVDSKYAPDWLVLHEAYSEKSETRHAALAEATRRLKANQLSGENIEWMVEKCLALQSDHSKPWDPLWGDWIESCECEKKLSVEQWHRYLTQGMKDSFTFNLRPKIHSGDPIPWELKSDGRRAGNRSDLQLDFERVKINWLTPIGNFLPHTDQTFGWNSFGGGSSICLSSRLENFASFPEVMNEGPQQFVLHATVSVGPFENVKIRPIVSDNLELFASTEVIPSIQSTMEVVDRPDLASAVRQSLSLEIWPGTKNPIPVLRITANNPPIGLAFDVYVRVNGIETKSDSFACPEGTSDRQWGMGVYGLCPEVKNVDIILSSSTAPALNNLGPLRAWKGEIEFKNVPAPGNLGPIFKSHPSGS